MRFILATLLWLGGVACGHAQMMQSIVNAKSSGSAPGYAGLGNVTLSSATIKAYYSCTFGYSAASAATGTEKGCSLQRGDGHSCDFLIATNGSLGVAANCSTPGDNGQSLTTWNNSSLAVLTAYDHTGSGFDLTCFTPGTPPGAALTGPSSLLVITFNGTTQFCKGSNPSISAPAVISVVANHTFNSAFGVMVELDASGLFVAGFFNTSNKTYAESGAGFVAGTASDSAWHAIQSNLTGGASSDLSVDGTQCPGSISCPASTNAATSTQVVVGANWNGASANSWFSGSMGEAAIMSGSVNSTEENALTSNQRARWGF